MYHENEMLFLLKYIINDVVIKYFMATVQIESAACKLTDC